MKTIGVALKSELNLARHAIPEELAALPQWVGWKYGTLRPSGRREKYPIDPSTGTKAKTNDPTTWGTHEEAIRCAIERDLDGIGFVPTREDDLVGIDFDNCINAKTSEITQWALNAIEVFDSYTEISPSGTGIRIFVLGELPEKNERDGGVRRGPVEMYDQGQYLTFTGNVYDSCIPIKRRQRALERLYARITSKNPQENSEASREAVNVPIEDAALVEKARRAGNGAKFRKLYDEGDASGHVSESEADLALMGILAFWTGRDRERMERLFAGSALGQREKWTKRADYRRSTVDLAVRGCANIYEGIKFGSRRGISDEVRSFLDELRAAALADPWTGRTGPAERWAYDALMNKAGVYGKPCDAGVIVAASSRDLALACGTRRQTIQMLLVNLEKRGRVRCIEKGRGQQASVYLLPRWGHKENRPDQSEHKDSHLPRWGHKEASLTPPTVFMYGPCSAAALAGLLAKVGNPAPQIEQEHDKRGRKISHESKFLIRPMGDSAALLVEKVAARPGVDLAGLSKNLGRPPSKVKRLLGPVVEGGFVFEDSGGYYALGNLLKLLEEHLEHAGCNYRERHLRGDYEAERERYAEVREYREREHRKRLAESARSCGAEVPEASQWHADIRYGVTGSVCEQEEQQSRVDRTEESPQAAPVAESVIRSVTEVLEIAKSCLGSP